MAEHGYARDYDEPLDQADDERRSGRGEDRGRGWRDRDDDWSDQRERREGNFMLGESDRGSPARQGRGREAGSFRTAGGTSSFSEGRMSERSPGDFSSHQDDHYRSWRNRQMEALDRDYADYCREREQQFHRDFDSWRENRQNRSKPQQRQQTMSPEEVMELNNPAKLSTEPQSAPSPTGDATLGTNNSENVAPGRR